MVLDPFSSSGEFEAWLQSSGSKNFEPVATLDDTAIGLAGLFPCGGNQSHSAWLILFVPDEFQGRGVGNVDDDGAHRHRAYVGSAPAPTDRFL